MCAWFPGSSTGESPAAGSASDRAVDGGEQREAALLGMLAGQIVECALCVWQHLPQPV